MHTLCDILDECQPNSPYSPHQELIRLVPDRPGHDRRYAIDITKINQELGWEPRQSLASGLLKTVEWYLSHPEWINAIRQQGEYQGWIKLNYKAREGRYKKL